MRKFIVIIAIFFAPRLHAQNDFILRMDGVGALKLDMSLADVEKVLGKKITLKNNNENGAYADTIKTKYKNTDITIYFDREYEDETKFHMVLTGLLVANPLFKTKEGISIGADKLRIISAYENSRLSMGPDYEGEDYHTSKINYSIEIYNDETDNSIIFHMRNKKVISIEIIRFYGD
jgi:hypothetical protein